MKNARNFLPENLEINDWQDLESWYRDLQERAVTDRASFRRYLQDISELESVVSENLAWRYIRMTCDTTDKAHEQSYLHFVQHIQPHIAQADDRINRRIISFPWCDDLAGEDDAYKIYFRSLRAATEIFREENIGLQTELQTLAQQYSAIQGALTIEWEGREITMEQAAIHLMSPDRTIREKVWVAMYERRSKDVEQLEILFSEMVAKRHQVAQNAGFRNFRDYMFKAMGRFDYKPEDCFNFHESIALVVVPMLRKQYQQRMKSLGLIELRPWDLAVDPHNRTPLKPFETGKDLLEKTLHCLGETHPFFRSCLEAMRERGVLDLESRKGKAPGGYNYPLAESNIPFIFMNASGKMRDVETLIHEAGHAVHTYLSAGLPLNAFKNTPSEVAELASMSMELITMPAWRHYFEEPENHVRAMREQMEGIIQTLPWIAIVDKFQHWIYENPSHSIEERRNAWVRINREFGTGLIDYAGYEDALAYSWHRQLHIFEVPFYYIEYGMAQLGAMAVWKLFLETGEAGTLKYMDALRLGYTRSIPEIYKTAGIRFGFDEAYVRQLFQFLDKKLKELN
jgi:oligoendopeptidase F